MSFTAVEFPEKWRPGMSGGPRFRTQIVQTFSGKEQRNKLWAAPLWHFNVTRPLEDLDDLYQIQAFFLGVGGRFGSFLLKDPADYRSGPPQTAITSADQAIGTGDGTEDQFQLKKAYTFGALTFTRTITKPRHDLSVKVLIAVGGTPVPDSDFSVDTATGVVTFDPGAEPGAAAAVTAGFEFYNEVRFDIDDWEQIIELRQRGQVQGIPLVEVRT